jgi:DUF971 family protein
MTAQHTASRWWPDPMPLQVSIPIPIPIPIPTPTPTPGSHRLLGPGLLALQPPDRPNHHFESPYNRPMPKPIEIKLHQRRRLLEVSFDSGDVFELPCEYLRVMSPSAEVQGHGPGQQVLVVGKEQVGIQAIHPVGNYAVLLEFDDGHNTGIYSWDTLYQLGREQATRWAGYLDALAAAGHERSVPAA